MGRGSCCFTPRSPIEGSIRDPMEIRGQKLDALSAGEAFGGLERVLRSHRDFRYKGAILWTGETSCRQRRLIGEFLTYLPTSTMTKKNTPRHPFHLGALTEDLDKLPERMREYNVEHHALRRINRETFRFDAGDGAVELMSAITVRQYMDYHLALCTEEDNPGLAPAYYDYFAATMNEHDSSGFGWARIGEDGTILWDDTLEPADTKTFCVLDSDIDTRVYLRAGEVATSEVELLDYRRLKDAETKNNIKWRKRRGDEKAQKELEAGGLVTVSLDGFAKKRKRLQRLVDDEGKKKARVDDTPGPEDGEVDRMTIDDIPTETTGPSNIANGVAAV
ncbi:hypothetical protein K438DRAFT_2143736 [Mycena galopus ATCC 62051]|nr:hypothetical protein K438DRAFT_2143736 [Mycena galopus ATCC 62051]